MHALGPIDLRHQGAERVIGCYLVETSDGLALNDCGPSVCVPALEEELGRRSLSVSDLDHLLLSHIHLDHAGAAGVLVRMNPELQVHVSEVGAPHLVDPSRLERSARRLYGDAFDELWGEVAPVPEENIALLQPDVLGLEAFPTPGHASHHACYLAQDGTLYAGDAAGVRIQPDGYACPPTPPPEFDLDTWLRTIDEIERREPTRLALIHFGVVDDPARTSTSSGAVSATGPPRTWRRRIGSAAGRRNASPRAPSRETYERAMPLWQSYAGLRRYWDKLEADGTGDPTIASRNAST